jgi:hypothetical protein
MGSSDGRRIGLIPALVSLSSSAFMSEAEEGVLVISAVLAASRSYLVSGTKKRTARKLIAVNITAIHLWYLHESLVTMNPQIKGPRVFPPAIAFLAEQSVNAITPKKFSTEDYLHVYPQFSPTLMDEVKILCVRHVSVRCNTEPLGAPEYQVRVNSR